MRAVQLATLGPLVDDYNLSPHQRPRRQAARIAAQALSTPRQPSPLELSPLVEPDFFEAPEPAGGGTNRKVSHSLIERRRREKINDCLSTLKALVPHCRAESEKKEARAKERGRKRGRQDESHHGGLHKLEILQGTIVYIEQLEAQLAAALVPPASGSEPPREANPKMPILPHPRASRTMALDDSDQAALLLLKFSTSPELRPVFF